MLKKAKIRLYHEILSINPHHLTDIEIELGNILARDRDIQDHLEKVNLEADGKIDNLATDQWGGVGPDCTIEQGEPANITKKTQTIFAVNKKTGEKKSVNLLHIGTREFNCSEDKWGTWHNYSKRGNWEIYIEI